MKIFIVKNEKIGEINAFPTLGKCEKTVSGYHHWTGEEWYVEGVYPETMPKCLACGLVDDRKMINKMKKVGVST